MQYKSQQIQNLTTHLQKKYGSTNIIINDCWEGDMTAIGLSDKTKQFTVYICHFGKAKNKFFVSLEDPPTTDQSPYSPGGDFDDLSLEEVELIIDKHLRIN